MSSSWRSDVGCEWLVSAARVIPPTIMVRRAMTLTGVEEELRVRLLAKNRRGTARRDRTFQGRLDRHGLARPRRSDQHDPRPQQGGDGEAERLTRRFVERWEVSLTHLLLAGDLVHVDDPDQVIRFEVCRWVIERQVATSPMPMTQISGSSSRSNLSYARVPPRSARRRRGRPQIPQRTRSVTFSFIQRRKLAGCCSDMPRYSSMCNTVMRDQSMSSRSAAADEAQLRVARGQDDRDGVLSFSASRTAWANASATATPSAASVSATATSRRSSSRCSMVLLRLGLFEWCC